MELTKQPTMKRTRVILNKSSLESLEELNLLAEKLNSIIVIGVLPAGTPLGAGETVDAIPTYMIINKNTFKEPDKVFDETVIAFSKEEVLEKIIKAAE